MTAMTALCDRPNLTANELAHMLSLAMPSLTYTGGFEWMLESGDFIKYCPDALLQHRWQVTEIILNAPNYRHTRKDGSCGNRTKRFRKRFASLVDAITFYETEIN
jgi:hypothetical protein